MQQHQIVFIHQYRAKGMIAVLAGMLRNFDGGAEVLDVSWVHAWILLCQSFFI
jgi:hypothetical protein